MTHRTLVTRRGTINFPAYLPVTTFGDRYPLDKLIGPYLSRLSPSVMVSYHYAQRMQPHERPSVPLWIDSGGFVGLLRQARIHQQGDVGVVEVPQALGLEIIHPRKVLELQEQIAEVALTLDFPIPPDTPKREARKRYRLTIENALWALNNCRRRDLKLYAVLQAWDAASAREAAQTYASAGFHGVALGGMIPRLGDFPLIRAIVEAVREEIGDLPLHALGMGKPPVVGELYRLGVDSVDSSSYVKLAADGRLWSNPDFQLNDPSSTDRMALALCNLATATGKALPLGAAELIFSVLRQR